MRRPDGRLLDAAAICAIGALALPVLFWRLGDYGFVNHDEALYHGVAEEMVLSGDPWTLEFRGDWRTYDTFMNAPWQYWGRALLIASFGSSYVTARLPSAGFALATALLLYAFGRRLDGRAAGLVAALALLTSYQFVWIHGARTGETDTAVCFLFSLSALLFLRALERGGSFVPHHLALAALLSLKLPVVMVPLLAELAFFALRRERRPRFWDWLRSGLLVAPLALWWHALQAVWLWEELSEILGKMWREGHAAGGSALAWRLRSLRYYAEALVSGGGPWLLVAPLAAAALWRRVRRGALPEGWLLVGLQIATVLGFFTLVAKRLPWYIQPVYPFLSLVVGASLAWLARQRAGPGTAWALASVLAGLAVLKLPVFEPDPFARWANSWTRPFGARSALGLAPPAFAGLAALASVAAAFALRRWSGERFPRLAAGALLALLFGNALARTLAPLERLPYWPPLERLRARIENAVARGEPLPGGIVVEREPFESWKLHYHFGYDWEIQPLDAAHSERGAVLLRRAEPRRPQLLVPLPPRAKQR